MSHLEPDPQLAAILRRVDAFEVTMHDQADRISAMRRELDGLWVSRPGEDTDQVSWVFRRRPSRDLRRSA